MNLLTKFLVAVFATSMLLAGCGKKEEPVPAPAVVEQQVPETNAAAEQAKTEAELAIEEAKKAAEAK